LFTATGEDSPALVADVLLAYAQLCCAPRKSMFLDFINGK